MQTRILLGLFVLMLSACPAPSGPHRPVTTSAAVQSTGGGVVGYDQVRPIFEGICATCHPARSAPNWLDYSQAKAYVENGKLENRVIRSKDTDRRMPPPGVAFTDQQRALIAGFIAGGGAEKSSGPVVTAKTGVEEPMIGPKSVQSCFLCHGPGGQGIKEQPMIPQLAGQNKDYLLNQLKDFKTGKRVDPTKTMNQQVAGIRDDQFEEIANYFSKEKGFVPELELKTVAADSQLFEKGKKVAEDASCFGCHRDPNSGYKPMDALTPFIAGQSGKYLFNQLNYFRSGERKNETMVGIASSLQIENLEALAYYISLLR